MTGIGRDKIQSMQFSACRRSFDISLQFCQYYVAALLKEEDALGAAEVESFADHQGPFGIFG